MSIQNRPCCKHGLYLSIASATDVISESRHKAAIVLYDEKSKQLTTSEIPPSDLQECPTCHRAFEANHEDRRDDYSESTYVSPQYFRRLATSRQGSEHSTRPPSPVKRLAQPGYREVEASTKPKDSEKFVHQSAKSSSQRISMSSFSPDYFKRFFIEEGELGRGGKGVVLLVTHVLDGVSLGKFACKRVPVGDDHEWLEHVLMEVSLLQNLSHQNLVSYRHVWLEDFKPNPFGPSVPHVFILQEYCNSGNLLQHVFGFKSAPNSPESLKNRKRRGSKDQQDTNNETNRPRYMMLEDIFSFFKDITSGLAHLHSNGYIHRDMKPQNCLLHRSGKSLRLLVSDFGEVQDANIPRKPTATGFTGTISFAAPEVLRHNKNGVLGNFTPKSDVFSLGMIVYFMCFGRLPYANADLDDDNEDLALLRNEIIAWRGLSSEHKQRADLPEQLYRFLRLLLSQNPDERPSTEEILKGIRAGASFTEQSATSPVNTDFNRDASPTGNIGMPQRKSSRSERPSFTRQRPSSGDIRRSPEIDSAIMRRTGSVMHDEQTPGVVSRRFNRPERSSPQPRPLTPLTPRLLPPPPGRRSFSISRQWLEERMRFVMIIKLVFFTIKILTITVPCSPFAPHSYVAVPLLIVAALDLVNLFDHVSTSLALTLLHLVVALMTSHANKLCKIRSSS